MEIVDGEDLHVNDLRRRRRPLRTERCEASSAATIDAERRERALTRASYRAAVKLT
jgi:hypothetical protein